MSQSFDQPPQQRKMHPGTIVAIVAGVAITLAVLCVGAFLGLKAIAGIVPQLAPSGPPKFAESDWVVRDLDEISLEAPCVFGPGPSVTHELSPEVRQLVDSMTSYQGLGLPESFAVVISRVAYKSHIEANLEGAVKGSVTEAASRLGDFNPKYDTKPITVGSIPAMHSSYKRIYQGQTLHMETVTACKDNRLWQVQVIYLHPESQANANRVLESVEIDY